MGIVVKNLTKAFDSKVIFNDFSLEIPDNGIVLITGRSGCGKTTLLRIISGIDKNYSGEILGVGSVSFAFQEYRLLPWLTAASNVAQIAFGEPDSRDIEESKKLLCRLGFTENELHLYPRELSGGMKQRVSLARAFAHKSDLLILDEPTKELDSTLCNTVYEIISEESKKRPVLLVTHESIPDWLTITERVIL